MLHHREAEDRLDRPAAQRRQAESTEASRQVHRLDRPVLAQQGKSLQGRPHQEPLLEPAGEDSIPPTQPLYFLQILQNPYFRYSLQLGFPEQFAR